MKQKLKYYKNHQHLPQLSVGSMCSQWHKWHLFSHNQHCKKSSYEDMFETGMQS